MCVLRADPGIKQPHQHIAGKNRRQCEGSVRTRKLLLHKNEINKLIGGVKVDGYTIVPIKVYFKGNYAKVEIALAKGKKLYDKRQSIAKKDQRREAEKEFKVRNLY